MSGAFVTIEGIDGAGKSTCAAELANLLRQEYPEREVLVIKTPGGTMAGAEIRKIVLDPELPLNPKARFLMFVADMHQITEEVIKPALEKGSIVISDRYRDSTYVYQIMTNPDLSLIDRIRMWDALEHMTVAPDMVFVLDLPVEIAKQRILDARQVFADAFELAPDEAWHARRKEFLNTVVDSDFGHARKISADLSVDEMVREMFSIVSALIRKGESSDRKAA